MPSGVVLSSGCLLGSFIKLFHYNRGYVSFKSRNLAYALINSNKVDVSFFFLKLVFYDYPSYARIWYKRSDFCKAYKKKEHFPAPLPPHPGPSALQGQQLLTLFLAVSYGYLHFSKYSAYTAVF